MKSPANLCFFVLACVGAASAAPLGIIATAVGGFTGDGGPAIAAKLNGPKGVAIDPTGIVYVADSAAARIRKVALDGTITTIFQGPQFRASTTFPEFNPGNPVSCPSDLATDAAGNVYAVDPCAYVVRKIDAAGVATLFAGKVPHVTPSDPLGDGGPATEANLYPTSVAVDAIGNVFISERFKWRIRKVAPSGVITTLYGGQFPGTSGTSIEAGSIAPAGAGGVYVHVGGITAPNSPAPNRIHRIDSTGVLTPIAGNGTATTSGDGGPATAAGLAMVQGLAVDGSGRLVATFSDRVRRIVVGGNIESVAAQGGGDLAVAGANLLVTSQDQVLRILAAGTIEVVAGSTSVRDGASATDGVLKDPRTLVVDASGAMFIADTGHHRIRKVDAAGVISTIAGTGTSGYSGDGAAATAAQFASPGGVALAANGDLYVADTGNHRVRRISAGLVTTVAGTGATGFSGDGGPATSAQLNMPTAVAFDAAGNLYVADYNNYRVRKVTAAGVISSLPTSVGYTPYGLRTDADGNPLIADPYYRQVFRYTGAGNPVLAAKFPDTFNWPPQGGVGAPGEAVADPAGNIYTVSAWSGLVAKTASPSSTPMVIAGTYNCPGASNCIGGFAGDGGPASAAVMSSPSGLFFDAPSGEILVADSGNDRIRKFRIAEPLPAPFSIPSQGGVPVATQVVSATVTPAGYRGDAGIAISGGEYSIGCTGTFVSTPATVQPGQGVCVRHVSSSANNATVSTILTVGARSATFSTTTVTGPGSLSVGAALVDFGAQSMGVTTPSRPVTLTNSGSVSVTVNAVTTAAPFAVTHDCASALAPGTSCTAHLTFKPAVEGAVEGVLTLQNSPGTQTVTLRGTGEKSLTTHYYRSILGRDPDAPGKAFWDGEAARMATLAANPNEAWFALAMSFYFSAEYAAFNRGDEAFVMDLYGTFFNRGPDAAGLAYWTGQLAGGMPREVLLAQFMFSSEFVLFTQAIFGTAAARPEVDVVMDFYRGLLARLPDSEGFNSWVARFRTAQCTFSSQGIWDTARAIASEFVSSAEYTGRNRTNSQFVGDHYNAFFRRGGDLNGVRFWVDRLDSGAATRAQVHQGFFSSAEFFIRISRLQGAGCYGP